MAAKAISVEPRKKIQLKAMFQILHSGTVMHAMCFDVELIVVLSVQ